MNWRDHLEETILAIMPFCFKNGTNLRGELDRPEFYGEDDTPGAFGYLLDEVLGLMKRAYQAGHFDGVVSATKDLGRADVTVDKDLDRHYSDNKFPLFIKELDNASKA